MRTIIVTDSNAYISQQNIFIASGYKADPSYRGGGARFIKKHKVSAGYCILWFIFGIIPLFIYLIYCGVHQPDDDVVVKLSAGSQMTTCPSCGKRYVRRRGYCPYCGYGKPKITSEQKQSDNTTTADDKHNSIHHIVT